MNLFKKWTLSRSGFFFLYVTILMFVFLLGFGVCLIKLIGTPLINAPFSYFFFFDRFFVEYLILLLLGTLLIEGNWICRFLSYLLVFIFFTIYLVQLLSLKEASEFISKLALANIKHFSLFFNFKILFYLFFFMLLLSILPFIIERLNRRKIYKRDFIIFIILGLFFNQTKKFLPERLLKERGIVFDNSIGHTSPIFSFYKEIFKKGAVFATLTQEEIKSLPNHYDFNNKYPLVKDHIYGDPVPFKKKKGSKRLPNIIVFFSEGLSARTINTYGSKFIGLTPNIDEFSKNSMVVFNYFNHTAATYRGLLGQLCSVYPKNNFGGNGNWEEKNINQPGYFCLNQLLEQNSYKTLFFNTHRKDNSFVDELITHIGFDEVLNAEVQSNKFLKGVSPNRQDALSDLQLFDSLIGFLKNNYIEGKPFFVGLYNIETHAWQNVGADGRKYGKGDRASLNTIHNYDHAFGKFWKYFKSSPFAKDTILILTADHAHYHEEAYVSIIKDPDYQKIFVDKIPLIIFDPTKHLPRTFDAKYSTSLDFAPSVIHLLGIPNQKNSFLGDSIFEANQIKPAVANFNDNFFYITKEKINVLNHSQEFPKDFVAYAKFILKTQELESKNRLWNSEFSEKKINLSMKENSKGPEI